MISKEHLANISRWQEFALRKGWSKAIYPTPHDRILSWMGLECPPVIFWNPIIVGVFSGVFFGVFWATFMYLSVWGDRTILQMSFVAGLAGSCFGALTALYHWFVKKKFGIRTWKEFVEQSEL